MQSHCCCSICSTKQQSVVNAVFASQFGTVSGHFQKTGQKLLNNVNSSPLAPFNVTSFRLYWTLIFWPLIKLNATELIINSSWLDLSLIQMDCQRWLALQRKANEREGKKESNKANNKNKKKTDTKHRSGMQVNRFHWDNLLELGSQGTDTVFLLIKEESETRR